MALSNIDRKLLERCLARKPKAWEDFVDRFMGLVSHVIRHTASARSIRLSEDDHDDLAADVFLTFVENDFAVLRHFRGESSLATYLTVISRRVVVKELLAHNSATLLADSSSEIAQVIPDDQPLPEERITNREEVQRLLSELQGSEQQVVRMYHLEGKSYQEISQEIGIAENSIGPTLSRARERMRKASVDSASQ